jgi:hypothetical protein
MATPAYAQVTLGTSTSATDPQRNGEANTGLYTPGSGSVGITSLGTEKMRVTGTSVGIGTTSPISTLEVSNNSSSPASGSSSWDSVGGQLTVTTLAGNVSGNASAIAFRGLGASIVTYAATWLSTPVVANTSPNGYA